MSFSSLGRLVAASATAMMIAAPLRLANAQAYSRLDLGSGIEVGGESERYARVLQISGLAPLTSWSIQPFSPEQVARLRPTGPNPWQARFEVSGDSAATRGLSILRPKAELIGNSAFPFQESGGPTWAGRGATGQFQAGVAAHWRAVHIQIAPLAFATQNLGFPLAPNGESGPRTFADPRFPGSIDAPQRFGSTAFGRLEPGTSSLVIDAFRLVAGIGTAPNRWGPAREYPLVLGPNAGGFPSGYVGSAEPLNLWLFKAHWRVLYAKLGQSAFTDPVAGERERYTSGMVAAISPRGVDGLEIGGSRLIHQPWPPGGLALSDLKLPFSELTNLFGTPAVNSFEQNQVASVFFRWALPAARAEFYGELYREDWFGKFHAAPASLIEMPDDYTSYTLGFQRVLNAAAERIRVLRGEIVNGEISHQQRDVRGFVAPLPPYVHSPVTQGHTSDGFILGSPEAYGGAGWRLGLDDFTPSGRRSFTLERSLRFDWLPTKPQVRGDVHPDVIYDVRMDLVRFDGARDYTFTLAPAIDLNRNLDAGHNVFNLMAAVTVRGW